jgi:hypothetical protein
MLHLDDFIVGKKYKKKYRAVCNQCGADRGYRRSDHAGICYACALAIRNKKLNIVAPSEDFIVAGENRHYKAICLKCGRDRGYLHKSALNKQCGSCSATERNKKRYRSDDPEMIAHRRLRHIIKSSITRKLRLRNLSKCGQSVTKILPYSIDELKSHLESHFLPNMSWDNYGEWEVDHITPDSWFQYSSPADQGFIDSWSLNNLQPLWKSDNRKKSNKFAG